MDRAPENAALAGQIDDGPPQSRNRPRGVFEVDEDAALAELEQAWVYGGYHVPGNPPVQRENAFQER